MNAGKKNTLTDELFGDLLDDDEGSDSIDFSSLSGELEDNESQVINFPTSGNSENIAEGSVCENHESRDDNFEIELEELSKVKVSSEEYSRSLDKPQSVETTSTHSNLPDDIKSVSEGENSIEELLEIDDEYLNEQDSQDKELSSSPQSFIGLEEVNLSESQFDGGNAENNNSFPEADDATAVLSVDELDAHRSEEGSLSIAEEQVFDDEATEVIQVAQVSKVDSPLEEVKGFSMESSYSGDEKTEVLGQSHSESVHLLESNENEELIKTTVGKFSPRSSALGLGAGLLQSENLKLAQRRITDLELELDKLRDENIDLSVAGETMLKRSEESEAKGKELENKLELLNFNYQEEAKLLKDTICSLEVELGLIRERNDTMEAKLSTNMQKIRIRERELENRLELVKMENAAVIRSKNEMILDLKRSIDQQKIEIDKFRNKGSELNKKIDQKEDTLKRTVKTLRMALTMIEGVGLKKRNGK